MKRALSAWERSLGLAPGEQCAESYIAYFEPDEVELAGDFSDAFGLASRGELVNAVITDRGRLVLRIPDGMTRSVAFDSKRPADVEVLGPTEQRLSGPRGGAERTQLVEVSTRGGASVRIIVPQSGVDALVRWGSERPEYPRPGERAGCTDDVGTPETDTERADREHAERVSA
ncbi:MAG TPA: hypothetical protein VIK61_06435 [Acidimicrobiia bacterium]